jgi:hypothetical protein
MIIGASGQRKNTEINKKWEMGNKILNLKSHFSEFIPMMYSGKKISLVFCNKVQGFCVKIW